MAIGHPLLTRGPALPQRCHHPNPSPSTRPGVLELRARPPPDARASTRPSLPPGWRRLPRALPASPASRSPRPFSTHHPRVSSTLPGPPEAVRTGSRCPWWMHAMPTRGPPSPSLGWASAFLPEQGRAPSRAAADLTTVDAQGPETDPGVVSVGGCWPAIRPGPPLLAQGACGNLGFEILEPIHIHPRGWGHNLPFHRPGPEHFCCTPPSGLWGGQSSSIFKETIFS